MMEDALTESFSDIGRWSKVEDLSIFGSDLMKVLI